MNLMDLCLKYNIGENELQTLSNNGIVGSRTLEGYTFDDNDITATLQNYCGIG